MKIGPGEADAGRERDGAAVDEMRAVAINEIRKARRTTDACESHDLFMLEVAFLEHLVERRQHSEISTAGTPRRGIRSPGLLRYLFPWRLRGRNGASYDGAAVAVSYCCFAHFNNSLPQHAKKASPQGVFNRNDRYVPQGRVWWARENES